MTSEPVLRLPRLGRHELRLCLLEARPAVQVIFLLRFIAGIVLVSPTLTWTTGEELVAGVGLWQAVVLCIYVLNGISDVVEDRANRSRRPIAAGLLDSRTAACAAGIAGIAAMVGAAMLSGAFLIEVSAMLAIGLAYSFGPMLKRQRAAAAMSVTVAGVLTYMGGSILIGAWPVLPLVILAVVMSLWMGLVGAAAKDFSDVEGDLVAGRYGGPLHDLRLRVRVCLASVGVAMAAITAADLLTPVLVAPFVLLAVGAAAVVGTTFATRHAADRGRRRLPYRAFMATQYAVHIGLTLPLLAGLFG